MRKMLPVIAVFGLAALSACGRSAAPGNSKALGTPVGIAQVTSGADQAAFTVHGVIAARDELRLSFKVGGVVARMNVEAGEPVHTGQVLAEIDPTEISAQLSQASETDAKAARDLERGEKLFKEEVISLEQLQNLRTQRQWMAAQLRTLQFNRTYARVTAPADGIVLNRLAAAHEQVAPGQPVLIVSAGKRGYVLRAEVTDRELLRLSMNLAARVQLDAAPEVSIPGKITVLSRAADPATGLFPIEITLASTPVRAVRLASGMIASARVVPSGGGTLVRLPAGALVTGDGTVGSVFVVEGGVVRRRAIRIAFMDGTDFALRSGLAAGETVVTDGAAFLDDGERIAVGVTAPVTPGQ